MAATMGSEMVSTSSRQEPCGSLTRTEILAMLVTLALVVLGVAMLLFTASDVAGSL